MKKFIPSFICFSPITIRPCNRSKYFFALRTTCCRWARKRKGDSSLQRARSSWSWLSGSVGTVPDLLYKSCFIRYLHWPAGTDQRQHWDPKYFHTDCTAPISDGLRVLCTAQFFKTQMENCQVNGEVLWVLIIAHKPSLSLSKAGSHSCYKAFVTLLMPLI